MDEPSKAFLREVVNELEDIRSSLVLLLDLATKQKTGFDAEKAKGQAAEINRERYEKLRKDLEAL